MGWMPAPLDISVWHSVWSLAKDRDSKTKTTLKNALLDFNVGFIGTAILACFFMALGAFVVFGKATELSSSAVGFSKQLIEMYTASLGSWSFYLIAIAAFTTMFSTAITCLDAFPRVLRPITKMLWTPIDSKRNNRKIYNTWIIITAVGTLFILTFFLNSMKQLVDVATTLSFVTTPIIAWMNYKVIFSADFPEEAKPSKNLKILSEAGLVFLVGFTLFFLLERFVF